MTAVINARQRLATSGGGGPVSVTIADIIDAGWTGKDVLYSPDQAYLLNLIGLASTSVPGLLSPAQKAQLAALGTLATQSNINSTQITDATSVGKGMLQAVDQAAQTALIALATTLLPGLMPAADKVKVNGLATLATTPTAANITDATAVGRSMLKAADQAAQTALLATATTSLAGLLAAVDKTKLDGLSNLTTPVSLANGGTGQTSALAAADALSGQGASIAGGNTVDLATVTGSVVVVTGGAGVTISSFGTRPAGAKQTLTFASSGAAIIHNGAALICPFGASIGVQAGDVYEVTSMGSGAWRVTGYLPVTAAAWKTALGLATLATTPTAANITDASVVGRSMLTAADQAAQTLLIAVATTSLAGLLSSADKTKLNGLATLATTPTAANITDASAVGRSMLTAATAVLQAEGLGSEIPTAGTNLGDANATLTIAGGAQYILPAATLTANRVITLGVTGSPITTDTIVILRRGTEAFTLTVQDDAATLLVVMPASTRMAAYFRYNGTHFVATSSVRIQ